MDYNLQIEALINYFKRQEKSVDDYKIGVEFEHFVIYKDTLKTVSYYGENGVAETLKDLEEFGYEGMYEGEYILGLTKGNKTVTLEPGSQFELSIDADISIENLEKEYLEFLEDIVAVLEKKNQELIAVGYHPETKIDEITLLPKKRYDYMFDYFKTKGTHAHNMMKGTAALQVSLDYGSEEDYNRKFRVLNALSPVFYASFENAFYFEGEKSDMRNMRSHIWTNCDIERSGIVKTGLKKDFSYRDYAEYILNTPPIFIMKDGEYIYTKDKLVKDIYDPNTFTTEELEHILTMVFPDVRTKRFVEVRMMDSIPYPLNFAVIALLKGIVYNDENMKKLEEEFKDINYEDVSKAKTEMMKHGLKAEYNNNTLLEIAKDLVSMSKDGLTDKEKEYLIPLEEMLEKGVSPYDITKAKYEEEGKKESLNWCILNNVVEAK